MKKYKYQISQLWKWHIGIVRYEKKLIGWLHPARLTYFSVLFELKIFYNSSYSKGPQPLIILSTVFSTIPDRCRYDTYNQLSFINLRALYETQIQTYPTTSDVMEEFLDIDLGEISKSESDLYKKDSLRWGKCCSTNPGLDPSNWSRTPGPPAEPLSTSKLKLKYRISNKENLNVLLELKNRIQLSLDLPDQISQELCRALGPWCTYLVLPISLLTLFWYRCQLRWL